MLISLPFPKFKEKVSVFIIIVLLFTCIYLYLNHLQQTYDSARWSGERCISELTSIKYQLNGNNDDLVMNIYFYLECLKLRSYIIQSNIIV